MDMGGFVAHHFLNRSRLVSQVEVSEKPADGA
jgi:hypothetical protein